MQPRRRGNPSTCHLRPLPPFFHPPRRLSPSSRWQAFHSTITTTTSSTTASFHPFSLEGGRERERERFAKRMRLSRPSWPSIFREVQQTGRARASNNAPLLLDPRPFGSKSLELIRTIEFAFTSTLWNNGVDKFGWKGGRAFDVKVVIVRCCCI